MSVQRVLVIGAAGMLGRPVVRRLIEDGFAVRGMVRNIQRARSALPANCELKQADVRDDLRLREAIDGCDAVYINLAVPMLRRPPAWDIEVDGTRAVIDCMRALGVQRILRISAMGVADAAREGRWWAAGSKHRADEAVKNCTLDWTIFQPTWFMESICTLRMGNSGWMACPDLPHSPLRWIAGDDYARQVSAALRDPTAIGHVYQPQGPEALTLRGALRRFCNARRNRRLRIIPVPLSLLRMGKPFSGRMHYLMSLMDMSRDHFSRIDRQAIPTDLPRAEMMIEDYARYVERTRDWPRK